MPPAVPWTAPATETSSPSSAGVGGNACGPELPGGTDAGGRSDDSAGEEEVVMEVRTRMCNMHMHAHTVPPCVSCMRMALFAGICT